MPTTYAWHPCAPPRDIHQQRMSTAAIALPDACLHAATAAADVVAVVGAELTKAVASITTTKQVGRRRRKQQGQQHETSETTCWQQQHQCTGPAAVPRFQLLWLSSFFQPRLLIPEPYKVNHTKGVGASASAYSSILPGQQPSTCYCHG